jgi:type VI secretion system protein ImpG
MSEPLDAWYQRELDYFRHSAEDFADRFPKIANRLNLNGRDTRDPHVERLIQAFAYLNARTRHKLDDSFPELADAMLGVLYPHMLAPVPSTSIVRFELSRSQKDQLNGRIIDAGTPLETERINGHECRFSTCYPVHLFPLSTRAVRLLPNPFSGPSTPAKPSAAGALRLQFDTLDPKAKLADYSIDHVRCYINVENFEKAARILELVLTRSLEVVVTAEDSSLAAGVLPPECIRPVGLSRDEALLPNNPRTFPGYRLLTEYFVLPQKFLFFDVTGLTPAIREQLGNQLEITVLLSELPEDLVDEVSAETIRTGCTPVINLFDRTADALPLDYRSTEYRIIPDARSEDAVEIYTVNDIQVEDEAGNARAFSRFYSVSHAQNSGETGYWHTTRRPGPVEPDNGVWNNGTEVYLTLMDPELSPQRSGEGMLYASLTCFNRDLPAALASQRTTGQIRFELSGGSDHISAVHCLVAPTPTLRRHLGRRNLWPLISQLSLNHLTLTNSPDAAEALREILKLNDVRDSVQSKNLIAGLESVTTERCVQRVNGAIARGTQIRLLLEDDNFSGDSAFLFSLIMNQFFGMYTTVNSFTKLSATTNLRESHKEDWWQWPAQVGEQALV